MFVECQHGVITFTKSSWIGFKSLDVLLKLERFSIECLKAKTKVIPTAKANRLKRSKTHVTKSWLVSALNLISWERGTSFLDHESQSKSKTNEIPDYLRR